MIKSDMPIALVLNYVFGRVQNLFNLAKNGWNFENVLKITPDLDSAPKITCEVVLSSINHHFFKLSKIQPIWLKLADILRILENWLQIPLQHSRLPTRWFSCVLSCIFKIYRKLVIFFQKNCQKQPFLVIFSREGKCFWISHAFLHKKRWFLETTPNLCTRLHNSAN